MSGTTADAAKMEASVDQSIRSDAMQPNKDGLIQTMTAHHTSYFLTSANLSLLKKVAHPSIAYEVPVYSSVVLRL